MPTPRRREVVVRRRRNGKQCESGGGTLAPHAVVAGLRASSAPVGVKEREREECRDECKKSDDWQDPCDWRRAQHQSRDDANAERMLVLQCCDACSLA